ncbi:ribonuclease H-like domain-containing protein [Tanacetum coccineum]
MVTRSQSGIIKPVNRLSLHTSSISPIPKSPFLALKDPHWCNAMYDEYTALVKNSTWILIPKPSGVNLVRSMWLFKHKFHADGTLSRYKNRLVTNGNSQHLGVDFDETFSPVVKPATIRTVLSLAVSPPGFDDSRTSDLSLYHDPREPPFAALKRILQYVHETLDFGLYLYASATTSLVGYIVADWVGCPSTHSAEAEYRGVANVVAKTAWLRNLLRELHSPLSTATLVYYDNVSAIYMSANPVQHQRTKHIEIDIHFIRDMVTAGQVRVLHLPSRYQYADIFTKGLP